MVLLRKRAAFVLWRVITASSLSLPPTTTPTTVTAGYLRPTRARYASTHTKIRPTVHTFSQQRSERIERGFVISTVGTRRLQSAVVMGPVHGSAAFRDKIEAIRSFLKEGGRTAAAGLQVIMDFDLTITAPGSEQCHHMFVTSSAVPPEVRIKLTPYIHGKIKVSSPEEWWDRFHSVLAGAKITQEQVASVAAGANVSLRHGTEELLLLLSELGVPLLIVSAGISDVIEETLRSRDLLLDNITVCANKMLFDEGGRLREFRESPPVHSRNKRRTAERQKTYFDRHPDRTCVIIVGDKPGDADVNHGVAPDERCLKIGYFDHSEKHPHPDLPLQILPAELCGALGGKGEAVHFTPQLLTAQEDDLSGSKIVQGKLWERHTKAEIEDKTKSLSVGTSDESKDKEISLLHMVKVLPQQRRAEERNKQTDISNPTYSESNMKVSDVSHPDVGQRNNLGALSAPARPANRIISSAKQKAAEGDGLYDRGISVSVDAEIEMMLKA